MLVRVAYVAVVCVLAIAVTGCASSGLVGTWESEVGQVIEYAKDGTYKEFAHGEELLVMGEYALESIADGVWAYEAVITHYKDHGEYWLDGDPWDQDDEDLWDSFGDDDSWDRVYDDIEDAMYEARNTGAAQTVRDGYGKRRTIEWRLRPLDEVSPPIEYYVAFEGRQAHFYSQLDGHAEGDSPMMTLSKKR